MNNYQVFLENAQTTLQNYLKEKNIDSSIADDVRETVYTVSYEYIDSLHFADDICEILALVTKYLY